MNFSTLLLISAFTLTQDSSWIKVYDFSEGAVWTAAYEVLADMNIPVKEAKKSSISTEWVETDLSVITNYIKEEISSEKPKWEKGRLSFVLTFQPLSKNKTKVVITTRIERFGVPSEFLLIPPAWTLANSNGLLEEKIFSYLEEKLLRGSSNLPMNERRKEEEKRRPSILPAGNLPKDPPFLPNVPVSNDPGRGNQNETTIGIFRRNYVCGGWNDNRTGVYHVGFAFSTDGGLTWSDDTLMIEPTYPEDADPVICIDDSGTVYYFWLSFNRSPFTGDIFLTKSRDGGRTWGPFICVTPNSPSSLDDKPWATIDGNNIFVTWYEYGTSNVLKFARSTDRGNTWSTGITVGSGGNGTFPFRGTDSTVYVGWGMQDVRLNKSTDMGRTWQGQRTIIPVTWGPGSAPWRLNNIPSFGTSRDRTKLYCVFADSRLRSGQLDVFFSRSTDGGQTWMTPVKVNDTPAGDTTKQFYPWLAVDPFDRIHVTWHDTRTGGGRLGQYYSYSTDFGLTWSENQRVSDTAVYSSTFIGDYTACAADSYYVYVLWCDARRAPDNPDIFFSKGPMRSDVGISAILSPRGEIDSGIVVTPKAVVENFGTNAERFSVRFKIGTFYTDDTVINLPIGGVDTVEFLPWTAVQIGTHIIKCTTELSGDINPVNDFVIDSVIVQRLVGITEPRFISSDLSPFNGKSNPTKGVINIHYNLPPKESARLKIYNVFGEIVYKAKMDKGGLTVKNLPAGIYFLQFETRTYKEKRKLIVVK